MGPNPSMGPARWFSKDPNLTRLLQEDLLPSAISSVPATVTVTVTKSPPTTEPPSTTTGAVVEQLDATFCTHPTLPAPRVPTRGQVTIVVVSAPREITLSATRSALSAGGECHMPLSTIDI